MKEERFLSEKERYTEPLGLRPRGFDEFIGQKKIINNIDIMVKSSKMRKAAMDHLLFSGPPGLGKTSLAIIVSAALETHLHTISGPALEKKGDLAAILTNLSPCDVLFIDEIHRINIAIEEILYSAMEDFRLDILIGQGASARTMGDQAPSPLLLWGPLQNRVFFQVPLRDRFMAHFHFDFYRVKELFHIIKNNAQKLKLPPMEEDAMKEIARCSRGTPRIANRILRRVRDFCLVKGELAISLLDVKESLKLLEIDSLGLDNMDRKILQIIRDYYQGGPVGIDALCATIGEERSTIEDVYEALPFKEGTFNSYSEGEND